MLIPKTAILNDPKPLSFNYATHNSSSHDSFYNLSNHVASKGTIINEQWIVKALQWNYKYSRRLIWSNIQHARKVFTENNERV